MISLILTFQMMSCTRSQINASSTENKVSVYANPETIQFTGSDRAKMFKQMYLKLGYEFPLKPNTMPFSKPKIMMRLKQPTKKALKIY